MGTNGQHTLLGYGDHNDQFGRSLDFSLDGSVLAVGANQFKGTGPGYAKVFRFNGTEWNQVGQKIEGDADQDVMGRDVSLSGDGTILAVGANHNDENGNRAGMVRIYEFDSNSNLWVQLGDTFWGTEEEQRLGSSVSMSQDGRRVAMGGDGRFVAEEESMEQDLLGYLITTQSWNNGSELGMSCLDKRQEIDMAANFVCPWMGSQ